MEIIPLTEKGGQCDQNRKIIIVFTGRSKCVKTRHPDIAFGLNTIEGRHLASQCLLGIQHLEGDTCAFAWRSADLLPHRVA